MHTLIPTNFTQTIQMLAQSSFTLEIINRIDQFQNIFYFYFFFPVQPQRYVH
jgi:hypothetical protein